MCVTESGDTPCLEVQDLQVCCGMRLHVPHAWVPSLEQSSNQSSRHVFYVYKVFIHIFDDFIFVYYEVINREVNRRHIRVSV